VIHGGDSGEINFGAACHGNNNDASTEEETTHEVWQNGDVSHTATIAESS